MLFIQRSAKSYIQPNDLTNDFNLVKDFRHLPRLMNGSIVISHEPKNINQLDEYSNSPAQEGIYTYRVTIAIPQKHTLREVKVLKPKGNPEQPWGYRDNIHELPLGDLSPGQYCGLRIPEHMIEHVLPYTTIYGTRIWGNGALQEVWVGDMMRQIIPDEVRSLRGRERW